MGTAGWYLAASELARRRRSVVLLALLVALVVGCVLTAVAGARRTGSAVDRYLEEYRGFDLLAFGDASGVGDLPAIEAFFAGAAYAAFPAEVEGGFFPMLAFEDGAIPYERMRAPLVDGRLADPGEPFEVALGQRTSELLGAGVGDRLPMISFTPEEAQLVFTDGEEVPPTGPSFELEVVGVVRDPGDITSRDADITLTVLTPAFAEHVAGEIGLIDHITMLDLAPGATDVDLAAADLDLDPAFSDNIIRQQSGTAISSLRTGLYALAAAIGIAGLVSIGQAVARLASTAASDDLALRSMGCSAAAQASRVVAPAAVAIAIGTLLGAGLSVLASPLHPIGLARRAEPDPGVDLDLPVLVGGIAGAAVLAAALVALVARRALGSPQVRAPRASRLAAAAARAGAPASVVSGLELASDAGGATRTPVRTAWTAAFAGTLGVLAAVVFAASIDRLGSTPSLYGWGWDVQVTGDGGTQVSDGAFDADALYADDDLEAIAEVAFSIGISIDGVPAQTLAIEDVVGDIEPIVVRGVAPGGPRQIALGGETIERVGASIGDEVEVLHEGGEPRRFEVVGVVALPVPEDGGLSGEGAAMTWDAALDLGWSGDCDGDVSCYRNWVARLAPGADPEVIDERYSVGNVAVDRPIPPSEVQQVQVVDRLPWLLAAFLAVLAVIAVGHTAWATVKRRRHDLTVLRTLGFTGAQLRTTVAVQVAALVSAGAVVGVLAGVVVGRALWRVVVDGLSLPFSPAVPWLWVVLVPVATVILAELVATVPRRAASRLRAADALRVE